jgi:F-type H+-transporting ATPase subunit delta
VAQAYEGLWNAHRNVARADVVSAQELSAAETQALRDALKRVTASADVDVKAAVDGTLVGGLIVTVGGRTYDGSVRGRLETLRTRLRGAA